MAEENKKQILRDLKELKSNKDYDSMLAASQKAIQLFPDESKFFDLMHYAQAHYVDEKLHSDIVHQLEEKKDWLTLQGVYQKLLQVFPESKKLKKLLNKLRKKIQKGQLAENRAHFDQIKNQIIKYMNSGRFDDALQACYEVLSHNPGAEEFERLARKIEGKLNGKIEKDLNAYFKTATPELKKEYKENEKEFIRV